MFESNSNYGHIWVPWAILVRLNAFLQDVETTTVQPFLVFAESVRTTDMTSTTFKTTPTTRKPTSTTARVQKVTSKRATAGTTHQPVSTTNLTTQVPSTTPVSTSVLNSTADMTDEPRTHVQKVTKGVPMLPEDFSFLNNLVSEGGT